MKEFWNERYREPGYVYGTTPNVFLAKMLLGLPVGRALFPAEGEGRNAVHAASLGWEVVCFDQSEVGREKALALAQEKGVEIDYRISSIEDFGFEPEAYQLVGLFFAHQPPAQRRYLHQKAFESLRPGGRILLQGFGWQQLAYQSGGPRQEDMLFTPEMLHGDFPGLEIDLLEATETYLSEGRYHHGPAHTVQLAGVRIKTPHDSPLPS
jgi:SAM-dependent methyltransferase